MTVRFRDTDPRPLPTISDHDQRIIDRFASALREPTRHLTAIALIRHMAEDGDEEAAAALAKHRCDECDQYSEDQDARDPRLPMCLANHAIRCCATCGTHATPHRGCILR